MSAITSVFLLARSAFGLGDAFFVPLLLSSGFFAVLRLGSGAAVSAAVLASDSFVIIVFSLSRNGFAVMTFIAPVPLKGKAILEAVRAR